MTERHLPPTLQKIGFEIPASGGDTNSSVTDRVALFIRHPVVLLLISFLLTGLVGTYLTNYYQRQQQKQEAHKKSMDEVRLSIDTTNMAFGEFLGAAYDLEEDLTSGTSAERVEQGRINLRKTRHRMENILNYERARIRQQMPFHAGIAFELATNTILVGTGLISDCLTFGRVVKTPGDGPYGRKVACDINKNSSFTIPYANERILKLNLCLIHLYGDFRPNPYDDFYPESQERHLNEALSAAGKVCNNEVMLGVKENLAGP